MQFITFRLADSLPQETIADYKEITARFNAAHPKPWDNATKREYNSLVTPHIESMFDSGYGSCLLRTREAREVVVGTLFHYDSVAYDMVAYVVMPNHVHLLAIIYPDTTVSDTLHRIKSYTSHAINKLLGRKGTLWQAEYFDRIVRSNRDMQNYADYIAANPKGLPEDSYSLYIADGVI